MSLALGPTVHYITNAVLSWLDSCLSQDTLVFLKIALVVYLLLGSRIRVCTKPMYWPPFTCPTNRTKWESYLIEGSPYDYFDSTDQISKKKSFGLVNIYLRLSWLITAVCWQGQTMPPRSPVPGLGKGCLSVSKAL